MRNRMGVQHLLRRGAAAAVSLALCCSASTTFAGTALSASAQFEADERCLNGDFVSDDILDVVEYMVELGYSVSTGNFELYNEEVSNLYIPFADDDTQYLVSHFDDPNDVGIRMGGQDAILYFACTPPRSSYFSHNAYNLQRVRSATTRALNASVSDPLNSAPGNIVTTNASDPYNGFGRVVVTGDKETYKDLQDAFGAAGMGDEPLNLLPVPQRNFKFSKSELQVPRDEIAVIQAATQIVDEHPDAIPAPDGFDFSVLAGSHPFYLFHRNEKPPVRRVFVRDRKTAHPQWQRRIRWQQQTRFNKVVNRISRHFRQNFGYELVSARNFVAKGARIEGVNTSVFKHGNFCIRNERDCMFDNRDDLYWWDRRSHRLGDDDYFVLVGLDYTRFGVARSNAAEMYAVVNPNNSEEFFDFIGGATDQDFDDFSITDVVTINGAALRDTADKSFMVQFARPENCLADIAGFCPDTDTLEPDTPFAFRGQLTLNPATGTRPDERHVVAWRLLQFKIPPP